MGTKGNKSSNIFQVLKSAGAWSTKDGTKPIIKNVGKIGEVKSPLKFGGIMPPTMDQKSKNKKAREAGKAVSYKDAYADADKKKYKTQEEFETAARAYNTKKYNSTNPTADAKKAGKTKEELAAEVAKKKTADVVDNTDVDNTDVDNTDTDDKNIKSTDVTVKTKKQIRNENKVKRLSNKAKKKGSLTKGQRRRLAIAEEKASGKSGKESRLAANTKLNKKKDDTALAMNPRTAKKGAKKVERKWKKASPAKCPLIAMAPAIMGAVGAMKKK